MAKKDKIKVIELGEILVGLDPEIPNRSQEALKKIYSENTVIATHTIKGQTLFVCEG